MKQYSKALFETYQLPDMLSNMGIRVAIVSANAQLISNEIAAHLKIANKIFHRKNDHIVLGNGSTIFIYSLADVMEKMMAIEVDKVFLDCRFLDLVTGEMFEMMHSRENRHVGKPQAKS